MDKITKTEKGDILIREYNKHFERKTMLELQIALQAELDPNEISAKKPLRIGTDGRPMSYRDISRKEHIEILTGELEDVDLILSVIEKLS